MAAYYDYGEIRWKIICGDHLSPIEKKAVYELYGSVRGYLPYIITVCESENDITDNDNVIYVGTLQSLPALAGLEERRFFKAETREEGFSIKVGSSDRTKKRTDVVIQGADPAGVLYGVYEFRNRYLDHLAKYNGYHFEEPLKSFLEQMPHFAMQSAPAIRYRGLWTWGHMIYDYRRYIDNMAQCKMNTLIMWNDSAPLNGREIVEYAHSRGVRVIWGFTCGWGEDVTVDPTNDGDLDYWAKQVVEMYDREYRDLGGDGIYFQGFTETNNKEIGSVSIAALITKWINRISAEFQARHPGLYVQFGIHGTSIGEHYVDMTGMTADVTPVWEDCGAFPFHYDPRNNRGKTASTLAFTKKLVDMAKTNGRYGEVLKGFTVLRWHGFEHYKGRIIVGETDGAYQKKRRTEKEFYWKFAEPYWINHADDLKRHLSCIAGAGLKDSTVTALVEDGLFEEGIPTSVGIYSELLWDCGAKTDEVIEKIYHSVHYDHT